MTNADSLTVHQRQRRADESKARNVLEIVTDRLANLRADSCGAFWQPEPDDVTPDFMRAAIQGRMVQRDWHAYALAERICILFMRNVVVGALAATLGRHDRTRRIPLEQVNLTAVHLGDADRANAVQLWLMHPQAFREQHTGRPVGRSLLNLTALAFAGGKLPGVLLFDDDDLLPGDYVTGREYLLMNSRILFGLASRAVAFRLHSVVVDRSWYGFEFVLGLKGWRHTARHLGAARHWDAVPHGWEVDENNPEPLGICIDTGISIDEHQTKEQAAT